jgi:NAD(P)-dependent dehydrogenase (short-subunit alcohol dehydrogenase family)
VIDGLCLIMRDDGMNKHCCGNTIVLKNHAHELNPDFPLGAFSTLFERWRRIFGHFFRSSLQIASYFRLIQVKTASKSASTIVSNPNGNSGLNNEIGVNMQAVFITGASSGLGEALAREYALQGARLGLVGRNQERLQALRDSLPQPEFHKIYAVDVNAHLALQAAADDFIQHAGKVQVVIACAGISVGTLSELSEDLPVFRRVMETNVLATVATFMPFIEHMKSHAQQESCRLVGIASVAGIRGLPGASAYSASKAAVISYCESLRVELRSSGIKVVTIAPGYIDTPMTKINSYAMPFLLPAHQFARRAVSSIAAGVSYRVIPWQMGVVAKILRALPNFVYDFAFSNAPRKARETK